MRRAQSRAPNPFKEENLFTKSRKIVAGAVAVTLATAGIAVAAGSTGADENVAAVDGKATPSTLPKLNRKPINLLVGVRNSTGQIDGLQENPASELISIGKNVKIDLSVVPKCTAALPNGSTTEFAKDACPAKSYIGSGDATVHAPAAACGPGATEPCIAAEPVVSVFNGPGKNELRLHTYSPALGPASPVVNGKIIKSPITGFGQALRVANAPETGALMITKFNATLRKDRKVAKARCKSKTIKYRRDVRYADDSAEFVQKTQKCKRR
jgi:hypothetical protein